MWCVLGRRVRAWWVWVGGRTATVRVLALGTVVGVGHFAMQP